MIALCCRGWQKYLILLPELVKIIFSNTGFVLAANKLCSKQPQAQRHGEEVQALACAARQLKDKTQNWPL
jgi:hypothetical protein